MIQFGCTVTQLRQQKQVLLETIETCEQRLTHHCGGNEDVWRKGLCMPVPDRIVEVLHLRVVEPMVALEEYETRLHAFNQEIEKFEGRITEIVQGYVNPNPVPLTIEYEQLFAARRAKNEYVQNRVAVHTAVWYHDYHGLVAELNRGYDALAELNVRMVRVCVT